MVQDKAYETGIPQKLGDHANTARDTAAQKYNDLTTEVNASTQFLPEMLADVSLMRTIMSLFGAALWMETQARVLPCPCHSLQLLKYDLCGNRLALIVISMLQAQKQHAAYRDVASDRLATAKAQAQDYAQSAQQRAADHMDRVGASFEIPTE